jgi:hypothetical protein
VAASITAWVVLAGIVIKTWPDSVIPTEVNDFTDLTPAEPYGGCDEAYLYPNTEGARICEELGYVG